MDVRSVDHIAIAVHSLDDAWRLFGEMLGGQFISGGDDTQIGVRVLHLKLPHGVKIELLEPLDPSSYLQGYLERRGPGFHHLTMFVDDVVDADQQLRDAGFETTETDLSDPQWRETYIRPKSGFGTLIQLSDTPLDWDTPRTHITPQDVIAGRVLWVGTTEPRLRGSDDPPAPSRIGPSAASTGHDGR